jgi:Alcohol dehydrogenase transcription factor Myb/SANT-like
MKCHTGNRSTAVCQWSYETLNLLISLYAEERLLWDSMSADYHTREERQSANLRIARAIGCDGEFRVVFMVLNTLNCS